MDYHIKNQQTMLSDAKIIALYCIVDDILKGLRHYEDKTMRVSDSEIITTAFVSALYFGGHLENGCHFMKMQGYIPNMLGKSRYCRRLHRLSDFLVTIFFQLGTEIKSMAGADSYQLDSFPVAVCDNARITRSKILKGNAYHGYNASKKRYFYGVKVQVMALHGIPVEFCLVPGSEHDTLALGKLPLDVAPESCIYMDAGYTDYLSEDDLFAADLVYAKVQRKKNSKRRDLPFQRFLKDIMRKRIESDFSQINSKMRKYIHAVTAQGFLLKVTLFVIAFAFDKIA